MQAPHPSSAFSLPGSTTGQAFAKMLSILLSAFTLVSCTISYPIVDSNGLVYHSKRAAEQNLPTIELPYGKWQASKYDAASDVRKVLLLLKFQILT
jgi:hypothetical protein